jgi:hypothetical protein
MEGAIEENEKIKNERRDKKVIYKYIYIYI